jgi:hypothetical protein
VADIEHWLASHVDALERVAGEVHLDPNVVFTIAVLVLAGFEDQEVLSDLRVSLVIPNGDSDPLEAAPRAIRQVRELVEIG